MATDQITLCVCGGGNAAHVMSGMASRHGRTEVRVLTLFGTEADVWTKGLAETDFTIVKHYPDGSKDELKGKPSLVTNDASKAVKGADVIVFCVPAFAHKQYFEAIAPHVAENTSIIGLPGRPGFEFQCLNILKERAKSCAILNVETLPWACRISEYGKKAEILGTKKELNISKIAGLSQPKEDPVQLLQSILGEQPKLCECSSYLGITLGSKAIVHPALMYGKWRDWNGQPLQEKPLFYQGLTEYDVSILTTISAEMEEATRTIINKRPEGKLCEIESIKDWFLRTYQHTIKDASSLHTAMKTNSAYAGLVHPMKETSEGKWVPDFTYRYVAEDIPFSLVVIKGIAQLAGVATPTTDTVLTWAQGRLGKEFIVGSELKGKDVKDTRAPQAFGIETLDDLMAIA